MTRSSLGVFAMLLSVGCGGTPAPKPSPQGCDATPAEWGRTSPIAADASVRVVAEGPVTSIAVCVAGTWRKVALEPRQLSDGEGFRTRITTVEQADRTGNGQDDLDITYAFVESLTALPPTGPFRRGIGRLVLVDGEPAVRAYVEGETDTAVATDIRKMKGTLTWDGPGEARLTQQVTITEDDAEEGYEHGEAVTETETLDAVIRWVPERRTFVVSGDAWTVRIPGL